MQMICSTSLYLLLFSLVTGRVNGSISKEERGWYHKKPLLWLLDTENLHSLIVTLPDFLFHWGRKILWAGFC